ncbi:MAG TPA: hypothetical protein VLG28_12860 [Acidimicrobiia bacterium]|jgi:hypothetical protein|nr:hypothetical protein [Acidimicrobiia bacterium]
MQSHRFDPISFFFGLLFAAIATYVLVVDDLDVFDARWVWPVVLIMGGVAVLASLFSGRSRSTPTAGDPLTEPADSEALADARAELPDEPNFR